MSLYMDLVYTGADGAACIYTGKAPMYATDAETRATFEKARALAVDIDVSTFLLDLHEGDDVVDVIPLDDAGFTALTGESVQTREEYEELEWRNTEKVCAKIENWRLGS